MEAEEHFYTDDPGIGPPDSRTTLKDVNYFFLGNGHISAVVQFAAGGEGTALALILMNPEVFGPKRQALTFDPEEGLAKTRLTVTSEGSDFTPETEEELDVCWERAASIPLVKAEWGNQKFSIEEKFYCPDFSTPRIVREIRLTNYLPDSMTFRIETGLLSQCVKRELSIVPKGSETCFLEYRLVGGQPNLVAELAWTTGCEVTPEAIEYWQKISSCQFDSDLVNQLFAFSTCQLPANIAACARFDSSIWQYNLEWVRDQSMIAFGLTVGGHFERAGAILDRLLDRFVTDKGDTLDSSRARPHSEVELDQNGELLLALRTYVDWSGDLALAKKHWQKIRLTADFPLQKAFRHPGTSLLHNEREYWERHALHGIEDGFELAYQLFVSLGLSSAACLADLLGHEVEASRWRTAAKQIKADMLSDPNYALIHNGYFIKRRFVNGRIQEAVQLKEDGGLPCDIPILEPGKHLLNPDSSSVLPIAFEFIDPGSELAQKTLEQVEVLWNQRWQNGGYGRYHVTSEPDSPGPWPFASLFIARAYLETGEAEKVWRILKWLNSVPGAKSGALFEFYGSRPIPPYPQIGIIPWIWAEQLIFFVHHLVGIRPSWDKLLIRPRLLNGIREGRASIRLRDFKLKLQMKKACDRSAAGYRIEGRFHPYTREGLSIDMPRQDIDVEILYP